MNKTNNNKVLFSGYAKLPTGITASEMYKVIGLVVVVNIDTGEILEADCTLATHVASKHVAMAIVGGSLQNGPEPLVNIIDQIYQGSAKKAIITSIRIICDKYRSYKDGCILSIGE